MEMTFDEKRGKTFPVWHKKLPGDTLPRTVRPFLLTKLLIIKDVVIIRRDCFYIRNIF